MNGCMVRQISNHPAQSSPNIAFWLLTKDGKKKLLPLYLALQVCHGQKRPLNAEYTKD